MSAVPFAMHSQPVWEERAANSDLPDWLRLVSLAYGKHRRNGHANFQPGDLRLALARVDTETGVLTPCVNVSRAVNLAVRHRWLARGSRTTCLVVPGHAVWGGSAGSEHAPCRVHDAV